MSLPLLTSATIPSAFRHGFTTRAGGISGAPFSSLNVGFKWGDNPEHVRENRRRIFASSGCSNVFLATQVHGAEVVRIAADATPEAVSAIAADALVASQPGFGVAVIVADCVPILLADPTTGACAAVHAGWRGTAANVTGAAVRALQEISGSDPSQFCAAIGPSIGPCCFEVGDDVVQALGAVVPGPPQWQRVGPNARPHVDLWQANQLLLQQQGLQAARIDVLGACTHCDPARFFSYRREGAATGQMMAFIGVGA